MDRPDNRARTSSRRRAVLALGWAAAWLSGCAVLEPVLWPAHGEPETTGRVVEPVVAPDAEVFQRAEDDLVAFYEREVKRLRADLAQAEESIVAMESGQRGSHTRADAVSAIAEARIAVERAGASAPWRSARVEQARQKLAEADRLLAAGNVGSAFFFASRAKRIGDALGAEAEQVARSGDVRFVSARRVNLRAGPSTDHRILTVLGRGTPLFPERRDGRWLLARTAAGRVGWIHASLVASR